MLRAKDYRTITRKTYSSLARDFAKRDRLTITESREVKVALKKFINLLPKGARVLDVGCGAGRDSAILSRGGLRVLGIDFSEKMIEMARKTNPGASYKVMDLEDIKFRNRTFDGIWANASLHHIPKSHLRAALKKIYNLLAPGGILFVKVKHGDKNGFRTNFNYGRNITRWFAFYKVEELKKKVRGAGFKIISARIVTQGEWVDVFARK